jgi:phage terminase small subunit
MPRGGARPGAGRPRKGAAVPAVAAPVAPKARAKAQAPAAPPAASAPPPAVDLTTSPLDYLLTVMRDPAEDKRTRLQAASLAAPYMHAKPAPGGKKTATQTAAGQAASGGRFGPGAPPLRVVGNR